MKSIQLDKKKLLKIASIAAGSILALALIFAGFKLVQGVMTRASDTTISEVTITAITQNTSKIGWSTDQETQGVIEYGTSPTALNYFAPEAQKGKKHTVDLTLLSPSTTYYFQIRIGDKKYDNGGVPWMFSTKSKDTETSTEVTGTPAPTQATGVSPGPTVPATDGNTVRPTSSIQVPAPIPTSTPVPLPTLASFVCGETNCITICQKIGKTCSSQDWMRSGCVGKVNLTTCTQIVPTNTPTPTPSTTPTPTPTSTPTPTPTPTATPTPTP
ncbi:MAG: fibronectin type III domain-containing protein [Patescibacteria group bacterium]